MLDAEIKFYKAATVNDLSTNGGLMSKNEYISGSLADVFQHVLKAERVSGSTKYRKVNIKNTNDDDEAFVSPQFWFDIPTIGDDWAVFFAATETDTQANITGSERLYGAASLSTDATSGNKTLIVTVEDASLTGMYASGDVIRVTDMTDPTDDGSGNEEFHVIDGAPSVATLEITITTVDNLANDYTVAGDARVMAVYEPASDAMQTSYDNWVETGSGTFDESVYPPELDNISSIAQTWTIKFTDASNFTVEGTSPVTGSSVGFLATGNVTMDYAEDNPDFTGKPYFTLRFAGFGGTWAQDDTIVFQTHPASIELWEKRVVPAGAVNISSDKIILVVTGESA